MRLIALVESKEHVCCRYRLAAFQPWLRQAGHELELLPFPRSWWKWLTLPSQLREADAVILQRRLLPRWQLALLRRATPKLIYDLDDALFLRDSYHPRGLESKRRHARFENLVAKADLVMAGNRYLADEAILAGAKQAHIVPTCIDLQRYFLAKHNRFGQRAQLVWVGSASTLQGIAAIRPILEQIGESIPDVSLKLICDRFLALHHMTVVNCPWDEVHEPAALASADIGISWLPDDRWSRGKCGLKVLQYMASGLPVVANPVGVQADLVRTGETGFLVETPEQWVEAVGRLVRDPQLRMRMGEAGRRRVEDEFSVAAGARKWLDLLDGPREGRKAA